MSKTYLPLGDGGSGKRGCCGCCFFKTGACKRDVHSNHPLFSFLIKWKEIQKKILIYQIFTFHPVLRSVRCPARRWAWSSVVATLIQRNFLGILSSQPHLVYDPMWDHKIHRNLLEFVLETKLIYLIYKIFKSPGLENCRFRKVWYQKIWFQKIYYQGKIPGFSRNFGLIKQRSARVYAQNLQSFSCSK